MADKSPTVQENLEAMKTIGNEGGVEALALVAAFQESSHRSIEAVFQSLYEGEKEAHECTSERLRIAEERLDQARDRFTRMFEHDPDYWGGSA